MLTAENAYRNNTRSFFQPYCITCHKMKGAEYRAANPERHRARGLRYYYENRERVLARLKTKRELAHEGQHIREADQRA